MPAIKAPATGARLDRNAAEALIARRLLALDHPADLLDTGAVAALVAEAAGSGRRLRTSLAATLFLASTEDAPSIDAGLVARALAAEAPPPGSAGATAGAPAGATTRIPVSHPPRPPRLTFSRLLLAGALSALAGSMAVLVLHSALQTAPAAPQAALPADIATGPRPPPHATRPVPGPAAPAGHKTGALSAASSAAPSVAGAAPPTLAPLPPPVAVRTLAVPPGASGTTAASGPAATPEPTAASGTAATPGPAAASGTTAASPAAATPAETADALPAAAPAAVLLLYPSRNAGALARLRPLALALQRAGFTDIRARPVHAPPARRVVNYFYSDDQAVAELIAKTLATSHWPNLGGNLLQPSLVLLPTGLPPRNPGTIEVQLP